MVAHTPQAHGDEFEEAIRVSPATAGTYTADLKPSWAIGNVPHGGYLLAILYRLACTHFRVAYPARHAGRAAPIGLQLAFVRRATTGPAQLDVEDVKLGARTSTVRIALSQQTSSGDRTARLVGYITVSDLHGEQGLSVKSDWALSSPPPCWVPPPVGTLEGQSWTPVAIPHPEFRKAASHVEVYTPTSPPWPSQQGIIDQWAALRSNENGKTMAHGWTNEAVAFLLDIFPLALANLEQEVNRGKASPSPVWFPTVMLNVDFKKPLPEQGVDWLYSRVTMKSIRNGRTDIEVVLMEESGELIALATQTGLVMSSERNKGSDGKGRPTAQDKSASPISSTRKPNTKL